MTHVTNRVLAQEIRIDSSRVLYENTKSKWAKVVCHWNQQVADEIIHHKVALVINEKSKQVYNDDSKWLLLKKFSLLTVGTPLFFTIKTIFHILFPISIAVKITEVYKKVKKAKITQIHPISYKQIVKKIGVELSHSFLDILWTPICAIALTVIAITTPIFSLFKPTMLYQARAYFDRIQLKMNWGNRKSNWVVAPCMLSKGTLDQIAERKAKKFRAECENLFKNKCERILFERIEDGHPIKNETDNNMDIDMVLQAKELRDGQEVLTLQKIIDINSPQFEEQPGSIGFGLNHLARSYTIVSMKIHKEVSVPYISSSIRPCQFSDI